MGIWKKALPFLLIAPLVVISLQLPVSADNVLPPPNSVLIAQDSFTADDETDLSVYTGGVGWDTGWVQSDLSTAFQSGVYKIKDNMLKASGYVSGPPLAYRKLSEPIHFDQDMDYYILYTIPSVLNIGCKYLQALQIPLPLTSNGSIKVGTYPVNNATANFLIGSIVTFHIPNAYKELTPTHSYTFLAYISAKADPSLRDVCRVKAFDNTLGETLTYTPVTWDYEGSESRNDVANYIAIGVSKAYSTGDKIGSQQFDEIYIYKSSPITVTKTLADGRTGHCANPVQGETIELSIPETDINGNSQSIKSVDWYISDSSGNVVSQLLPTQTAPPFAYTVPQKTAADNMIGKILRAKMVVTSAGGDITYYPVSGYVRDDIDVWSVNFTQGDTNGTPIKNPINPNSKVAVSVQVVTNTDTSKPVKTLTAAVYDSNNRLKKTLSNIKSVDNKLGQWTIYGVTFNNTSDGTTICTFENGDYIKVFLWDNYNNIKPMHINSNSMDYDDFKIVLQTNS